VTAERYAISLRNLPNAMLPQLLRAPILYNVENYDFGRLEAHRMANLQKQ